MHDADRARRRLLASVLGWVAVALLEAGVYTLLAWSLLHHAGPLPVIVLALLALAVTVLVTRGGFITAARLAGDFYQALLGTLGRARLGWFTANNRQLLTDVAGRGVPTLMSIPAHHLQPLVLAPLVPLLLCASIALVVSPATALCTLLLWLVALVAQLLGQWWLRRADSARDAAAQHSHRATQELVDHLTLLRSSAGPARTLSRLDHSWSAQQTALERTNLAAAPATLIATLASVLPLAGVLLWQTAQGPTPAPVLLALIVLVGRACAPLADLALTALSLNDVRDAWRRYHQVLAAPALPDSSARVAVPADATLTLEQVQARSGWMPLSATLTPGARMVIRGPSGGGKSTLLGLMMRFDDPAHGQVTLGGVPLPQLPFTQLAEYISYVPQEPVVFSGSLADNITLGAPADVASVRASAEAAALGPLLARSPAGLDQAVGHHGSALSGGERQRLALARALFKPAPILILDEATSALDPNTEAQVAAAVIASGRTLVVVTHRDPAIWQPTQVLEIQR